MIRKMPDHGGDPVPRHDAMDSKLEGEWGQEMCHSLEELMETDSEADFCDMYGCHYHVKTLVSGHHYTIHNIREGTAYGVAASGYIHPGVGHKEKVEKEEVVNDVNTLWGLKKQVP